MLGCVETHCGLRDGLVRRIARNWFFSEAGVFELREKFSEELRSPTYNAAQRLVYEAWHPAGCYDFIYIVRHSCVP